MRPTIYTEELLEKARNYLSVYTTAIPSHIGLARHLKVGRSTIYQWAKEPGKEEFADILEDVNMLQHEVLWDLGLRGEYNAQLVKLALGKHGYNDKSEVDVTTGGEPMPTTINLVAQPFEQRFDD